MVVVSEFVGGGDGLGHYILVAQSQFNIPEMYAGILFLGLLGFVLNGVFVLVERRALSWHHGYGSWRALSPLGRGRAADGSARVRVASLGKRYVPDGPPALCDVTFDVHEGEFVCVVGPSGCGKTTLLRVLSGLTRPSEGAVLLDGRPVLGPPPEVALVFQDYNRSLFPWLTVLRNVMFPLRRTRDSAGARGRASRGGSARPRSPGRGAQVSRQLSGGMAQRVAIARALVSRPRLLLLDEPFASVDALTREELQDVVLGVHGEIEERRMTVVHVTHDIDEAVYLGDRVLILSSAPGRVVGSIEVDVPRPREQTGSRSSARFLAVRNEIHEDHQEAAVSWPYGFVASR